MNLENNLIVCFKWVNFMVYELCLNKDAFKNQSEIEERECLQIYKIKLKKYHFQFLPIRSPKLKRLEKFTVGEGMGKWPSYHCCWQCVLK